MYQELKKYLKHPFLYERTTEQFWTAPHISKQMLNAHLDTTLNAASYAFEIIDDLVEWIVSLNIPENAKLLDIGCGPGLYTKRFSEHGLTVTGLDFSENSINYAKEHDSKSRYIIKDYLSMDFNDEFDVVTLIMCDYGALIPSERNNLLGRVYRALKPKGLFIFDVLTPERGKGKEDSFRWEDNPNGGFMSSKPHIMFTENNYYGEVAEGRRIIVIEEQEVRCYNLWDCYFTEQSLTTEVIPFGFSHPKIYTGVAKQENESMFVVLQKD